MSQKLKLLITGSCGFIFSNFIRKIIYDKQPYTVVSVDKVSKNLLNNIYWNKNHTFHIADITDSHIMNTIFEFEKPDIVIHGAAENFVDSSTSNPTNFINTNVLGTQVIIDCCVKWGVEKIIYMSTYEVYGHLTSESDPLWKEDATLNPRNPYSATKAAGEMLVKAAHESFGLNYNIIRSSNNYGPRQTSEKLIPKVIKCILNNEKIPIYGQGLQIRDWTHVFDNCNGILSVLNNGKINETYNISANQEFTNIEVVQKICNTMNKGHDLISYVPDRPGHDFRYGTDSSKIRELGWKQQFKFKDGIKDSIEWFNSNSWFLNH